MDEGSYDMKYSLSACGLEAEEAPRSRRAKGFVSFRGRSALTSKPFSEDDEDHDRAQNTVNVLSTTTEASMSSSSFAIPRRATIEADVSFLNIYHYRLVTTISFLG